ncbi:MAG: DUF4886 domain-containing protein [Verrucomicrobiota bacterium]
MKTSLCAAASLLRTLCFLICFLPFVAQGAAPASRAPIKEVKLLTIGNSFADNATAFLPMFAASRDKQLRLFRANLGGHSLAQHVGYLNAVEADSNDPKGYVYTSNDPATSDGRKFSLRMVLKGAKWDVVTIQQLSSLSYKPETYQPYANILIDYIHQYAPQAKILIFQTWAYSDDYYPVLNVPGLDQQKMYRGLKAAYQQLSSETGLPLIPVGDAFQKVRALPQPIVITQRGDRHANANGQYLAAAMFYETLFHDNVTKVSFVPEGVQPGDAKVLRAIAHETLAEAAHAPASKH